MLYTNDNAHIVGLTGMSGAGKTTACMMFARAGFCVIDCDIISRRVVERGKPALADIAAYFSDDILTEAGGLDRRKLGNIVFSDNEKLNALDSIIYPYITFYIVAGIRELSKHGGNLILLDAPTLFESGADALCDKIVSVTADTDFCAGRIMERDRITREQAEMRLASQHDAAFYRERSDMCIENSGSLQEFESSVAEIVESVKGCFVEKA